MAYSAKTAIQSGCRIDISMSRFRTLEFLFSPSTAVAPPNVFLVKVDDNVVAAVAVKSEAFLAVSNRLRTPLCCETSSGLSRFVVESVGGGRGGGGGVDAKALEKVPTGAGEKTSREGRIPADSGVEG